MQEMQEILWGLRDRSRNFPAYTHTYKEPQDADDLLHGLHPNLFPGQAMQVMSCGDGDETPQDQLRLVWPPKTPDAPPASSPPHEACPTRPAQPPDGH